MKTSRALLAVIALAAAASAGHAVAQQDPRSALEQAATQLKPHTDGYVLDNDPASPDLLAGLWQAVRAEAADNASNGAAQLCKALSRPGLQLSSQCLQLEPGLVLVSAGYGEMGDVFSVTDAGETPWSIGESPLPDNATFLPLTAWQARRASASCRLSDRGACGPVHAQLGRLPKDAAGNPRFFVDATYAQAAGATVRGQLSIWTWRGAGAQPLYVQDYEYYMDQPAGVRLQGDRLLVREKGEFKTFVSCGGCEGRQMDRAIEIGPDGVRDLGEVSIVPALDLIDDLLDTLVHHRPTGALASAQTAADLKAIIDKSDIGNMDQASGVSFGMLESFRISGGGPVKRVCLVLDEVGGLDFTVEDWNGSPRVTGVRISETYQCPA